VRDTERCRQAQQPKEEFAAVFVHVEGWQVMANEGLAVRGGESIAQVSDGFGSQTTVRANETSTTALAAQAKAQIEARYIVAMQRPRDMDTVRTKLLKECSRPGFAKVARYSKPVGGSRIEGPSIRFAEAALRCMGNVVPESFVVWDDEEKRVVRVSVTDIESNLTYSQDVVVPKTVERKKLGNGQQAIATRANSFGDLVYIVRATDDDLLNKQNALVSKALRTQAIRLLPGDILEECMTAVVKVQSNEDAKDPDAAKKALLDAFAKIGVMPNQLAEYLGHETSQVVAAELVELRAVYSAISEGETTWQAVMASKKPVEEGEQQAPATQKAVEAVKARLNKKPVPANKQQIVETTSAPTVLFDKRFSRDHAGKPLSNADQATRGRYLSAIRTEIADQRDNQPAGFEAKLREFEPLLAAAEAEDEALRAEGQ
jgi:hypothetical protein